MKKIILLLTLFALTAGWMKVSAQGVFHKVVIVKGDLNTFYPVQFVDSGYAHNVVSEMEINRSNVHQDSAWRGSEMATFRYHVTAWGNGANFIDAKINQGYAGSPVNPFIAGWQDVTTDNSSRSIIIWLRGGTSTYYLTSNYDITPVVYDGVANAVPYILPDVGRAIGPKTALDSYVNSHGYSGNESAYFTYTTDNYFAGNVGIGAINKTTTYKLLVEGMIGARKIKVTQAAWSDYVFNKDYKLPTLQEVEAYVQANHHLPDVPSADSVTTHGLDLGEMNNILLKKLEEQTLYLIELNKKVNAVQAENERLKKDLTSLQQRQQRK